MNDWVCPLQHFGERHRKRWGFQHHGQRQSAVSQPEHWTFGGRILHHNCSSDARIAAEKLRPTVSVTFPKLTRHQSWNFSLKLPFFMLHYTMKVFQERHCAPLSLPVCMTASSSLLLSRLSCGRTLPDPNSVCYVVEQRLTSLSLGRLFSLPLSTGIYSFVFKICWSVLNPLKVSLTVFCQIFSWHFLRCVQTVLDWHLFLSLISLLNLFKVGQIPPFIIFMSLRRCMTLFPTLTQRQPEQKSNFPE